MKKSELIAEIMRYLEDQKAQVGAEEALEIERTLLMYRFLPKREYGPEDVVVPSALVELELGVTRAYYFLTPQGGGLVTRVQGHAVQVITAKSPLGEALLGKKKGDKFKVSTAKGDREYRVISIS